MGEQVNTGSRPVPNALSQSLARACKTHLTEEKWLIVPSLRTGHQWLESLARTGRSAINLRIRTVAATALSIAGAEMAARGVRLVSRDTAFLLIDRIWTRLREKPSGYLYSLQPTTGLVQTIYRAIYSLRLAGIDAKGLDADSFEVARKGRELSAVMREYASELKAAKLLDYADSIRIAISRLSKDAGKAVGDSILLLPEDTDLLPLEEDLVAAWPADRIEKLRVDRPGSKPRGDLTDAMLLRWIQSPSRAPAPAKDETAEIFSAAGEANETREVLHRILSSGTRLDEVELLYTDSNTYVPILYETFTGLGLADDATSAIPVTFEEGLPVRYSRPGRALAEWLGWLADDMPQSRLVGMVRDGLLVVPGRHKAIDSTYFADLMSSVAIGFGRDRYLARVDEELAGLETRRADSHGESDDPALNRRLTAMDDIKMRLVQMRDWLKQLLDVCPSERTPAELLGAAMHFLKEFVRTSGELDNLARDALLEDISKMLDLIGKDRATFSTGADDWLTRLAAERRVMGSGPRPGHLHAAHVKSGGHSLRPNTFILGLDDSRWPGAGLQDPLLLDHERDKVSDRLETSRDRLSKTFESFANLLSRLRGHVTLSYSSRDLVDDRLIFPGQALVAAHRILSGRRSADQADLIRTLGAPASFAPSDAIGCVDESEWWLLNLTGPEYVDNAADVVMERFTHLRRGSESVAARNSELFTPYDGALKEAGAGLDPCSDAGRAMSASSLERLGQCPLRYFFADVLRIAPPRDLDVNVSKWLDAAEFGSLLHELFRQFMAELIAAGQKPSVEQHAGLLERQLAGLIDIYRRDIPTPSESVFSAQCNELRRAAKIFLIEEEDHCKICTPWCLEASIGLRSEGDGSPIDSREPVRVPLPSGRSMLARGRIDRVDILADTDDTMYGIWDYKTGSPRRFDDADPFRQGRVVQPALYVAIADALLRDKVSDRARVAYFGYFFASARGRGERKVYTPAELTAGGRILELLSTIAARGAFCATNDIKDCRFCDYADICKDTARVTAGSKTKLACARNETLASFRKLRGLDEPDDG